jgi:hypothetical protein
MKSRYFHDISIVQWFLLVHHLLILQKAMVCILALFISDSVLMILSTFSFSFRMMWDTFHWNRVNLSLLTLLMFFMCLYMSVCWKSKHILGMIASIIIAVDWRVRPLVLIVKLWAHKHDINNAKNMTISSYSLVLMVIHFLQCEYYCFSFY